MRLSRAKALSNGEWVYGYPIMYPVTPITGSVTNECYIVSANSADYSTEVAQVFTDVDFPKTAVDADTLEELVGAIGNNGVNVYVGDIITANVYPFEQYNAIITFNTDKGLFEFSFIHVPSFEGYAIFDNNTRPIAYLANANVAVIGNIISNPELL